MKLTRKSIPKDWPVKVISTNDPKATICYTCGLSWDDRKVTPMTPAPSGRCPFEAFHVYDDIKREVMR